MDQEIRLEFEKLHGRVNDLKERVVNLEAQQPHISAALARIERDGKDAWERIEISIGRLNGHLSKGVWIIVALFLTAIWRLVQSGGIPL